MTAERYRVAILLPADVEEQHRTALDQSRFSGIAEALAAAGIEVVGAPYADEFVDEAHAQLLKAHSVLVWLNPIAGERDRSILNRMLRDAAARGVLIGSDSDVTDKIGTREVLYRARPTSWGCDSRLYSSLDRLALARQRRVTRALAAEALEWVRGAGNQAE
jgi:hypothetical protein